MNLPLTDPSSMVVDNMSAKRPHITASSHTSKSARERLLTLRELFSQTQIAEILQVDPRTIRRWELGQVECPSFLGAALDTILAPPSRNTHFRFIDLFAGIGGIRMAFEKAGGLCVFTSEWDKYARQTYAANFRESAQHLFIGDITQFEASKVPDHDILLAGFPCQPFSIAGVSKKNSLGRAHGFQDATQGTLFFDVARILREKRPRAFVLENVKNLQRHDSGNTFAVIRDVLERELRYNISFKVLDSRSWVPQGRQRIVIVGIDSDRYESEPRFDFDKVHIPEENPTMSEILHTEDGSEKPETPYTVGTGALVCDKYKLSGHLWKYLRDYAAKHRNAGNGFGYGLVTGDDVARTLSARYHKDGSEILVSRGPRRNPRRLTPRECARLMGFPDDFIIPVSDTQAYRQFGNSVVVPMMSAVADALTQYLDSIEEQEKPKRTKRSLKKSA
jgi:DNA (cytosine-5)-methyltransferase 1